MPDEAAAPGSRSARPAGGEWGRLLLLALLVVLPRLLFLDADPPGDLHIHFITDEGWWAHNARQQVLFGHWIMDEHNPPLFSTPLYTLLLWWLYKLLGVSFATTRLLSGLAGIATCAIVYAFVRREVSRRAAYACALALGCGYFMLTNNRAGFVESLQLAFATLAILAAVRSREAAGWAVASGLALLASLLSKPSAIPVGGVIAAAYAVLLLERGLTREARIARWRAAGVFAATVAAGGAAIAVWLVLPHWSGVATEFASNVKIAMAPSQRLGGLERLLWFGFRDEPGEHRLIMSGLFAQEPLLVLSVVGLAIARVLRRDPRPCGALERCCWVWAGVMLVAIAAQSYQPDRRYLLLVPPLSMLLGLAAAPEERAGDPPAPPRHIGAWRWLVGCGLGGLAIGLYARSPVLPLLRDATSHWAIGVDAGFGLRTLLLIIWAGSLVLAAGVVALWRGRGLPGRRLLPAMWLLVLVLGVDLTRASLAAGRMTFTIRDVSRDIGRVAQSLPADRRAVVGNTSDTMCLDNRLFAFLIRIWPEVDMYMNRDGLARFRPGLALITERRGLDVGGVEGFSTAGMVPVRVYAFWPEESGEPRLRTTLYAPAELAGRIPPVPVTVRR